MSTLIEYVIKPGYDHLSFAALNTTSPVDRCMKQENSYTGVGSVLCLFNLCINSGIQS